LAENRRNPATEPEIRLIAAYQIVEVTMEKPIVVPVAVLITPKQPVGFAERLMKCTAKGARTFTPFQLDPAHKRFNAYGCQN
jgi:hypothetical protein